MLSRTTRLACLLLLSLSLAASSADQRLLSPRLMQLQRALKQRGRSAESNFWHGIATPMIEPDGQDRDHVLVTFLFRGNGNLTRNVVVMWQNGKEPADNQMARMHGTDIWYRTYVMEKGFRFCYTLSPNDDLTPLSAPNLDWQKRFANVIPDLLNPKRFPAASGNTATGPVMSVAELPGAPLQPWITVDANVPAGRVTKEAFTSKILGREQTVWVYEPPGPREAETMKRPLVLIFDGRDYLEQVPTPVILDNLIAAGRIIPPLAVFIDSSSPAAREQDLSCEPNYERFLREELLPWLKMKYGPLPGARASVVAGSSLGGLTASCASIRHPELFGNVISMSGSFWWKPAADQQYEWVSRTLRRMQRLPIRFYLTVGVLEKGPKPGNTSQLETNRRLSGVLREKGYDVFYSEYKGAHEYLDWQGALADALIWLLPARQADSRDKKNK